MPYKRLTLDVFVLIAALYLPLIVWKSKGATLGFVFYVISQLIYNSDKLRIINEIIKSQYQFRIKKNFFFRLFFVVSSIFDYYRKFCYKFKLNHNFININNQLNF